jgi:DHA1 family multidrug resistance protein-like MFS transporter
MLHYLRVFRITLTFIDTMTVFRPVLWGPLSEIKGRRLPLVIAAAGAAIFQFAVAASKDIQSILINRFFAGFFGTSPLAVAGAVFADMYGSTSRGIAVRYIHIHPLHALLICIGDNLYS